MSLPVRLVFGNNSLVMPVQAESITMATHRKLHAFPVPITSERIGVDINQATMAINMSLILEDDRGMFNQTGYPLINMLSFASYPTDEVVYVYEPSDLRLTSFGNYAAGATSISVTAPKSNALQIMIDVGAATSIYDTFGQVGTKLASESIKITTSANNLYKFDLALTGGGLARELKTGDLVVPKETPFASKVVYVPVMIATDNYGTVLKLIMDGSTTSSRAGGSGNPSVRSGHNLIENGDVIIDVPVGGIDTNSDNGNPAQTIALVIKDALELTTTITNLSDGVDGLGGKRVVDAIDVSISTDNNTVLFVSQKYIHPDNDFAYNIINRHDTLTDTITIKRNAPPRNDLMSAGDKAQTLLGLMANAKSTDVLRGIQIPYDSLIQSDAVTPEVRNFFTTYGNNAAPSVKGSVANVFPASSPMGSTDLDSYDGQSIVDNANEDKGFVDTILDKAEDALDFAFTEILNLGTLYDGFEEIATAIGETFSDGEVQTVTHAGGIYVLPENFHLRKEAGKNHYVADLELVMVHRVAGV
jgi:hypothetical protein